MTTKILNVSIDRISRCYAPFPLLPVGVEVIFRSSVFSVLILNKLNKLYLWSEKSHIYLVEIWAFQARRQQCFMVFKASFGFNDARLSTSIR